MEVLSMLRSINDIIGKYQLMAQDGEIGKVKDFYFSDLFWTIRYLVADTGGWLDQQLVLISPVALGEPEWSSKNLPVALTKERIENSPPVEKDRPVSRQKEDDLISYYNWPMFTYGIDAGHYAEMKLMAERLKQAEEEQQKDKSQEKQSDDPHLRSIREVSGYSIRALDGNIGHVEDFIFDDMTWILRYMVIDTRNWLPGRKVLISLEWIKDIDWATNDVSVAMTCDSIKNSPEFDPSEPVNRGYETQLYDYYGRPRYW
jgi:hypothetical protein